MMLLPFQGVGCASHLPRAMPWAGSFLAFQAVFAELAKVEILSKPLIQRLVEAKNEHLQQTMELLKTLA